MKHYALYFFFEGVDGMKLKTSTGDLARVRGDLVEWLHLCVRCGIEVVSVQIVRES